MFYDISHITDGNSGKHCIFLEWFRDNSVVSSGNLSRVVTLIQWCYTGNTIGEGVLNPLGVFSPPSENLRKRTQKCVLKLF